MMQFIQRSFNNINITQLYDLMALRVEIFVVEQDCSYQDLDYKDQAAQHFLCYENDILISCARVLFDKEKGSMSLGRVVTKNSHRGQGLAKQLMLKMLNYLKAEHEDEIITISAQCYLEKFYQSFGFKSVGEEYLEDGLPHIKMIKEPQSLAPSMKNNALQDQE